MYSTAAVLRKMRCICNKSVCIKCSLSPLCHGFPSDLYDDQLEEMADAIDDFDDEDDPYSCTYVVADEDTIDKLLSNQFVDNGEVISKHQINEMINEINTNMSWTMYDEYGNETEIHKELMSIINKYCN